MFARPTFYSANNFLKLKYDVTELFSMMSMSIFISLCVKPFKWKNLNIIHFSKISIFVKNKNSLDLYAVNQTLTKQLICKCKNKLVTDSTRQCYRIIAPSLAITVLYPGLFIRPS